MKIVFDTYAWIEYFLGSDQGKCVESYLHETVITPFIVLLELSYRADKEGWPFKRYLDFITLKSKIVGVTETFVLKFGALYNTLKKKKQGIGMADVIVLLTALEENAQILTGDRHFEGMSQTIFLE